MIMTPSQDSSNKPDLDRLQSANPHIHVVSKSIFVGLRSDSASFKLGIIDFLKIQNLDRPMLIQRPPIRCRQSKFERTFPFVGCIQYLPGCSFQINRTNESSLNNFYQ